MMGAFEQSLDFILAWEGGFVDDPQDPGGATRYGISSNFLKGLAPELADTDGDGDVDTDDIRALTREKAAILYRMKFWDALKLELFPERVAFFLMDTAVNMGKRRAVLIVQSALVAVGQGVAIDGLLGPRTRMAVVSVNEEQLIREALMQRIWTYLFLCNRNKALKKFLFGWLNRVQGLDAALALYKQIRKGDQDYGSIDTGCNGNCGGCG